MIDNLSTFKSKINTNSDRYKDNYQKMMFLLEQFNIEIQKAVFQGEEKAINKIKKENRLLTRERIELLLDEDSPFLELLPLAGWGTDCYRVGSSVISGIGLISNKICLIVAHVGTVKVGAIDSVTLKKLHRLNQIAEENNMIVVNLIESSGANLMEQAQIFNYAGTVYRDIAKRSKNGISTISVVFGSTAAGGAYIASISDYIIMVKESSKLFLAGPSLVKMGTGEVVDEESLGGSAMHSKISGVTDYVAETEYDAIRIAREIVYYHKSPDNINDIAENIDEPIYSAEELPGIISDDVKIPFDSREVIARIVDGSRFSEFKPDYGITLVTGFAKIHGHTVGFIANNGVLFSDSANKAAHFIQLCNQNNCPIIFLQNITGFIIGKKYEEDGIIKNGAKMLNTVANSEVPLITIVIGASYGAGNFAMAGRSLHPRFLFTYPNSKMAVMGPEQLSGVLKMISSNIKVDGKSLQEKLLAETEKQSSPYFATGQLWDDGIIDPRETRNYLGICLETINKTYTTKNKAYAVFRM